MDLGREPADIQSEREEIKSRCEDVEREGFTTLRQVVDRRRATKAKVDLFGYTAEWGQEHDRLWQELITQVRADTGLAEDSSVKIPLWTTLSPAVLEIYRRYVEHASH